MIQTQIKTYFEVHFGWRYATVFSDMFALSLDVFTLVFHDANIDMFTLDLCDINLDMFMLVFYDMNLDMFTLIFLTP